MMTKHNPKKLHDIFSQHISCEMDISEKSNYAVVIPRVMTILDTQKFQTNTYIQNPQHASCDMDISTNATLTIHPQNKTIEYNFVCTKCDYKTEYKSSYEKHLLTTKHQKQTNVQYTCDICLYTTCNKKYYNKHLQTNKHKQMTNHASHGCNKTEKYVCKICCAKLSSRQSLHRHKIKCEQHEHLTNGNANIIMELMKQNYEFKTIIIEERKKQEEERNEFKQLLVDIAKKESNIINNTQHNQFNLNMFLNEKCKDAMNFMDFVNSLQVSFEELENMANKGYIAGMSDIILNGLRQLDVYHRPIHCTDIKRETMYIKDNNEWIKDEDQTRVKKVITMVGRKNMRRVGEWQRAHPKCEITDSKEQYLHMNIMQQCLNGETQYECQKNDAKIIKNIAKFTYLDKGRNIAIM